MVAKLRTLTGCLHCRRRRKKCDENKPSCLGCRRNGLYCQWQSTDHVDKRRLRHQKKGVQKYTPPPCNIQRQTEFPTEEERQTLIIPTSLNHYQHVIDERGSLIVEYCLFSFLPSQYHQAADGRPTVDLSYLRYMCLESRLLLNAVSSCALVSSHKGLADASRDSPDKLYMNAISEISTGIAQRTLTGTEDHLLATVLWLCVYENSRVEVHQQSSIHAAALRRILLLRQPMDCNSASTSELVWERMCVESYIYHSAVSTFFDGQLSVIEDSLVVLNKFQNRVLCEAPTWSSSSSSSSELSTYQIQNGDTQQYMIQSPVLGAPYRMFFFLMEGIRLVRTATCPGHVTDDILVWSRYYEVHRAQLSLETDCARYSDSRRWIGKLYAVAIRLLFLYVISSASSGNSQRISEISSCAIWYTEMNNTLSEARSLLIETENDIDRTWGKFFLWPLAIIGAVMIQDKDDISLVRGWLDRVVRKSNHSSVLIIRKVLEERIWEDGRTFTANANPNANALEKNNSEVYTRGLSIMFNTDIMNHAAASLVDRS